MHGFLLYEDFAEPPSGTIFFVTLYEENTMKKQIFCSIVLWRKFSFEIIHSL